MEPSRVHRISGLRTVAILTGIVVLLLPLPTMTRSDIGTLSRILIYSPAIAYALWVIFRFARAGVHIGSSRMIIVNPIRTYKIPWNQVRGFVSERSDLMPKIAVQLEGGRRIGIFALPLSDSKRTEEIMAALEAEAVRARARSSQVLEELGQGAKRTTPWWWTIALTIPASLASFLAPLKASEILNRPGVLASFLVFMYGLLWLGLGRGSSRVFVKEPRTDDADVIASLQARFLLMMVMASTTAVWGLLAASWTQSMVPGLVGAGMTLVAMFILTPRRSRLIRISHEMEGIDIKEILQRFGYEP